MQEAYRLRRINYSICYLRWGVPEVGYPPAGVPPGQVWQGGPEVGTPRQGYPPQPGLMGYPRWGTPGRDTSPLARSDGGYPRWGTPHRGTPWLGLTGGGTWGGVPPSRGTPLARSDEGTWGGVSPAGGTPGWTCLGYNPPPPTGLDLARVPPPPLWIDRWMDRHMWKNYLPVVLRTRSVIIDFSSQKIEVYHEPLAGHQIS